MAFLRDRSVFCIPEAVLSYDERYIIGGICLFTAIIGFTGAALQLRSLKQFKDRQRRRPSPNPNIIFYLALSDLIACAGLYVHTYICLQIGLKILSVFNCSITKFYIRCHHCHVGI